MEAMTLATKICLINNGVLQQYEAPLTVYSRPNNLFVADFVGNPSINFIEAKGVQNENGSLDVTILDGRKAKFVPKEHLDLLRWFAERDKNRSRWRQPVTKRKCRIRKLWRNPTRMKSSSIILPE